MEFKELVKQRYAAKKFDGSLLPQDKVDDLLEIIRYSASSFGLQPYKVILVKDSETKQKLLPASFNQEQITTCSHILVFCADTQVKEHIDKYDEMMKASGAPDDSREGYIGVMRGFEQNLNDTDKLKWATNQTFLAVDNAINGATSLGFASCPMEGFSSEEYSKILNLPDNLKPACLVTIGVAADEPRPKLRYSKEDLFQEFP